MLGRMTLGVGSRFVANDPLSILQIHLEALYFTIIKLTESSLKNNFTVLGNEF